MLSNKNIMLAEKMRNIFKREKLKNHNEHKIKNRQKNIVKYI